MTAYTPDVYPSQTGVTTDYAVSFDYINQDYVKASVDGVPATFTWLNASLIRMDTAPVGDLTIYRDTYIDDKLVTFVDGSAQRAANLNTQNDQVLHAVQEIAVDVDLTLQTDGIRYDAGGQKIINVGDPTDDQDAATKTYVDAAVQGVSDDAAAAAASAAAASADATSAAASASQSLSNSNLAYQWANEAEDVPVETGPNEYSAYHWAKKAEANAGATGGSAANVTFNNVASGLSATNVQDAIDEVEARLDAAESLAATNAADIATNASDIATNASDIAANTAALADKAPLASPALTGTPTAPTASPGTNSTQLATTEYVDTAVGVASALPTGFTSTDQTITAGGQLVLAHGLDDVPALIQAFLVCQTGEFGYTAGDIVPVWENDLDSDKGYMSVVDATNITVRYGAASQPFRIHNKTNGVGANATNANWKLRIKAWV